MFWRLPGAAIVASSTTSNSDRSGELEEGRESIGPPWNVVGVIANRQAENSTLDTESKRKIRLL